MQHFITVVEIPASINNSHAAVALSLTVMPPIQKNCILVSLHCTHSFSIIVNNHKTKAKCKWLLISGLVSLCRI